MDVITVAKNENVGDVENAIKHVKERFRAICTTLPFRHISARMIIELVNFCIMWINAFQSSVGVSAELSPRTIMTGQKMDFTKHCRSPFGAYCETHNDLEITNDAQVARSVPCICLGPVGSIHSTHKFLNLDAGQVVERKQWRELPMPDNVICWVEALACRDHQPPAVTFTDCNGDPFGNDEQADYAPADQRGYTGVDLTDNEHTAHGQRALFELPAVFLVPIDPDQPDDQPNDHNNVAPPMENNNDDDGIEGDADNIGDMPYAQNTTTTTAATTTSNRR